MVRRNSAAMSKTLPFGCCAARSLSDALDALDHVLVFRTVLVPHRFHRVLERRLVGDRDDLAAGGLRPLHGFLLEFLPELALLELGFAGKLLDQVLVIG